MEAAVATKAVKAKQGSIEWCAQQLGIEPLTTGRSAVFNHVARTVRKHWSQEKNRMIPKRHGPSQATIPTQDNIVINGRRYPVRYSTRSIQETLNGAKQIVPDPAEQVVMYNGTMTVTSDQMELYYYLMICNYRRNNKNRVKKMANNRPPLTIFVYVDAETEKAEKMGRRKTEIKAMGLLNDMDDTKLAIIAEMYAVNTNQAIDSIRYDLSMKMSHTQEAGRMTYEKFLALGVDERINYMGKVAEGKRKQIIAYREDQRAWVWTLGPNKLKDVTHLFSVAPGKDPVNELVVHFITTPAKYKALRDHLGEENTEEEIIESETLDSLIERAEAANILQHSKQRWLWHGLANQKLCGHQSGEDKHDALKKKLSSDPKAKAKLQGLLEDLNPA